MLGRHARTHDRRNAIAALMNECPTLPATGLSSTSLVVVAAALLIVGGAFLLAVRWRRHSVVPVVVALVVGCAIFAGAGHSTAASTCPPPTTAAPATSAGPTSTTTDPGSATTTSTSPTTTTPTSTASTSSTSSTSSTTSTTSTTSTPTTSTTSTSSTTTTEAPVPPVAVPQTVVAAAVLAGSLIDDGDFLGNPSATITNVSAVQGGAVPFDAATPIDDTDGRLCGTITVAAGGGYQFTPNLLPGPHTCTIAYTLSNAAGDSSASETFEIPGPPP